MCSGQWVDRILRDQQLNLTSLIWDTNHESPNLTVLMIFSYTCQHGPSITVIISQTGPPEERWEHQPTNKVFDPKLVLSKRTTGNRHWRIDLQVSGQPILRPNPLAEAPMTYAVNDAMLYLRKKPSILTLWEALPSSWLRQVQIQKGKHWCMLWTHVK